MRWSGQDINVENPNALPGMGNAAGFVRSIRTPEFEGITFHEVLCRSALNKVPAASRQPFGWTINPYRGCLHQCVYCFARTTHEYLELDAGRDFDTQIVVKTNVVDVLRRELAGPNWKRETVALGSNTDPYQRAEGRYALMPGIIDALAASGTPLSILTKGTLLRRDLPHLTHASEQVGVSMGMSIAIFDPELQRSIEPGTPSTAARLATVRAVREAGLDCQVFLMPVLPHLTDSTEHLDEALRTIRDAGASHVMYTVLHLRGAVKAWYFAWLERERPELVEPYRRLYPGTAAYAPKPYRRWLGQRIRPLIRRYGLDGSARTPNAQVVQPAFSAPTLF